MLHLYGDIFGQQALQFSKTYSTSDDMESQSINFWVSNAWQAGIYAGRYGPSGRGHSLSLLGTHPGEREHRLGEGCFVRQRPHNCVGDFYTQAEVGEPRC